MMSISSYISLNKPSRHFDTLTTIISSSSKMVSKQTSLWRLSPSPSLPVSQTPLQLIEFACWTVGQDASWSATMWASVKCWKSSFSTIFSPDERDPDHYGEYLDFYGLFIYSSPGFTVSRVVDLDFFQWHFLPKHLREIVVSPVTLHLRRTFRRNPGWWQPAVSPNLRRETRSFDLTWQHPTIQHQFTLVII